MKFINTVIITIAILPAICWGAGRDQQRLREQERARAILDAFDEASALTYPQMLELKAERDRGLQRYPRETPAATPKVDLASAAPHANSPASEAGELAREEEMTLKLAEIARRNAQERAMLVKIANPTSTTIMVYFYDTKKQGLAAINGETRCEIKAGTTVSLWRVLSAHIRRADKYIPARLGSLTTQFGDSHDVVGELNVSEYSLEELIKGALTLTVGKDLSLTPSFAPANGKLPVFQFNNSKAGAPLRLHGADNAARATDCPGFAEAGAGAQ